MSTTIGRIFDLTVMKSPNKEALYDVRKDLRFTYREWSDEVNRLANALMAEGVKKGDRVSTFMFNTEELGTAFFACAKIGAVFNPINFRLQAEEVAFILSDAAPKVVLFEEAVEPVIASIENRFPQMAFWFIDAEAPEYAASYHEKVKAEEPKAVEAEVDENDLYAIMYTSGTTGRPKGVMHKHRSMAEQSLSVIGATKLEAGDVGLVTAPMFHCAELHCAFLPRIHAGGSNVILHQFHPKKVLELIDSEKITKFFAAPTMWNMILQENLADYNIESLKLGLYGAAPMAPSLVHACHERLGIKLVQAYGMTEMGPAITFLSEDDQLRKAGAAGQACLNHEIRVVKPNENGPSDPDELAAPGESGEIIVQGPCMMMGYFNREEASEKAMHKGWYHSGDIGYLDEDGYLWIKDRVDDMIISGGENIYPREVEDVLHAHEGVLDVAIVGMPDDRWGESVTAFVVKKDPGVTEEELDEWCRKSDSLANYKRPRKYEFVEELPRNASGKIQKFVLRKRMEDVLTEGQVK
ncbi:long-chain fatty acid--CoA ligase [[Bacillus] enclensis]|uniref:Fatty-acyl-CoA synthase n=1 Tax=[Bacillus] enclensis TaxID=1402860 RepID=A0A0V8HGU0_9BACI|nr:fatty acid--CoA ligase [[Bacillus] enclensis]KSU61801.1 long-chain fatty acid--CoA ligase [[Bacillus] enclensis]SCC15485.1 fatty-acyl-CoA synthase [[Bacillus] enclensis]